jgi:hypothetical protein
MAASSDWTITVTGALRAHFKQLDGTSRPGADWIVALAQRGDVKRIMVRVYAENALGKSPEQEAQMVAEYVGGLLGSGWSPADYHGEPGEITIR